MDTSGNPFGGKGVFLTSDPNVMADQNILTSLPNPQFCQSIDPSGYAKLIDENSKLKEQFKNLERSVKKYQSFLGMGAVEQETLLKSSERFEIDKRSLIDEQKKELMVFNERIKTLHMSTVEKDNEIDEWKKIAEDNIMKGGNSGMRDLKLKSKEVDTLKRQVNTLKNSELDLKKKTNA